MSIERCRRLSKSRERVVAPSKISQDIRIMSTPVAHSSSVICEHIKRHIRDTFRKTSAVNSSTKVTWDAPKACQRATLARVEDVTADSACFTRLAGGLGSHCPDSLCIRISSCNLTSHDIRRIGTYLCWRREGRNDRLRSQTQATASRRQLVCRDGRQSRDVDALFKRVSRLCTNYDTLFGVLNAVFKIAAAFRRWGGCVTTRRSRTLPLSGCSGRRRDGPSCSVSKEKYTGVFNHLHRGCCGRDHACDSCRNVKVRAAESCSRRTQCF
jgi:hypothetical protein